MNTQPDNASQFPVDGQAAAPARMAETRPMYWSVVRELWENRFVYIAPVVVTLFVLLGSFISIASMPHRMRNLPPNDPAKQHALMVRPLDMAPAPIMLVTFLIGMFYSLDALYGERRDRSILFWKSLPVSDRTTILSKASIPFVVLPLIAFALSVIAQVILQMVSVPLLLIQGVNPAAILSEFQFFQGLPIMAYGLAVHALWFAPIYGWLMLISAWARRAPFLWAILPPLAVAALERMAFNSTTFMHMLGYRVTGAMKTAFAAGSHGDIDRLSQLTPGTFLSTPGLWFGLLFAAACLYAAAQLRRNREPI